MRYGLIALIVLALTTPASRAGLYVPGQPGDFLLKDGKVIAQSFDQFRLRLSDLIGISIDSTPPSDLRRQFLAKRKELNERRGRLTFDQLNQLGAYDYRLGDVDGALSAWQQALQMDRRSFAVHSHLALQNLAINNLDQARRYDEGAGNMPKQVPGMTPEQSAWYIKVEGKLRQLIRSRWREQRQKVPFDQLTPDDLFGIQFVSDSGSYEPGQIAADQKEKLPEDAIAIVQQLLLWLPHDSRLYWLLAELYNVSGEPAAALTILNECVDPRRFYPKLLLEHRRVLQDHVDQLRAAARAKEEHQEQSKQRMEKLFWGAVAIGGVLILVLFAWQAHIYFRRLRRGV